MTDSLTALLSSGGIVAAPGIYDGLSARLAQRSGFSAVYLSGYAVSASLLGQPDAGFLTLGDMAGRVKAIRGCSDIPLIADADTGFGDIAGTVRAYEGAGASALQLEDQRFPKRCGHTPGREVVPLSEALDRVKEALDARRDASFQLIARTDARTSLGLDAAIERATRFAEEGADIVFIESPETREELGAIPKLIPGMPCLANMVEGGRTPFLPPAELEAMGFAVAIYPVAGLAAAAAALEDTYAALASGQRARAPLMPFDQLNKAVGFEEIWQADAHAK